MLRTFRELKANEFYKNVFMLISATSVAQGVAFLIYPVLTRLYTTEEHGLFSLYMSIIAITAIISTGKYELAVLMPRSDKRSINLTFLSIFISLIFGFFLLVLIILFGRGFAHILGNDDIYPWLFLVPISTVFIAIFQSLSFWANRHKRYRRMAEANVSQSFSNSIIKVSTSGFFTGAGGLIVGAVVGQVLGVVGFIADIFGRDRRMLSAISRKELIKSMKEYKLFPKFSMLHYLVNNFSTSMPVFAITAWFSLVDTGVYSLAFLIVYRPINLMTNSFGQVFSQKVVSRFNEGKEITGDVKRFTRRLVQLGLVPFLIVGLFAPVAFPVIFGAEWSEAARYMQILLPWMFFAYLASPLSFLPDMLGKQKNAMWIDIIKFIIRFFAIVIGIYFSNIYIMLICFSFVSMLITVYALFWYIRLAGVADRINESTGLKRPGVPLIENQDLSGI